MKQIWWLALGFCWGGASVGITAVLPPEWKGTLIGVNVLIGVVLGAKAWRDDSR